MSIQEETIEVLADTQRVYEMLTEFEHYPDFMPGVIEVTRSGATLMHWVMEMNGQRHEFDAQVVQMDPEERIAFQTAHSEDPVTSTLEFNPTPDGTRITFRMENVPADWNTGGMLRQALLNFKAIAEQGPPTIWPTAAPTINTGL